MARPPKTPPRPPETDWATAFAALGDRLGVALIDRLGKLVDAKLGSAPGTVPQSGQPGDPYADLGAVRGLDLETYEAIYKARAKLAHPDKGGPPETMSKLNAAIKKIREELGPKKT